MEIDIERLRKDLMDYFTAAYFCASPLAIMDLTSVEYASDEELIQIAINNKFDLSKYEKAKER